MAGTKCVTFCKVGNLIILDNKNDKVTGYTGENMIEVFSKNFI